jgi:hypothetical protein
MAEKSVKLRKDQPVRRYVGIDVTKALDTVAFGHMWNAVFGWSNLVWDLDKDPADNQRRVDKAHPKLPIKRLVRSHGGSTFADTCIMPENVDGSGPDAGFTSSDMDASDTFMHTFILRPSADGTASQLNDAGTGNVADLVYLSSHGLHNGEMFGDAGLLVSWLFQLTVTASQGGQFAGPGWLVLSNCGTLDTPTHEDWTKVMSGPTPLRGIVGFREVCPLEGGSAEFAAVFINRLALGASMLNAWKSAVTSKVSATAWIVLCHDDAKDDTIADWNAGALKAISAGSKILRFDSTTPASGAAVVPTPDPFEAFWSKGGTRITAINMFDLANQIAAGDTVTITVKPQGAATFTAGAAIAIAVVYIRVDFPQKVDITKMFQVTGQTGMTAPTTAHTNTANPSGSDPDTWKTTVDGTPAEIVLTLKCLDFSMLKERGVPLRLQVNNGTTTFLFVRNGSVLER